MKYLVKTLGCKANLYDSQLVESELRRRGWVATADELAADLCIVNSCTVTDEADKQSGKLAQKLGRLNPGAKIVMTGCGAEVDPAKWAGKNGVHYVVGNQNKPQLAELVLKAMDEGVESGVLGGVENYSELVSRHPMDREWPLPASSFFTPTPRVTGESRRKRAFLKIQEGCNSFCTYCIIPYGRGPNRSLKINEIVAQVRTLVEQGIVEVVITGTNIGDYGTDWSPTPQHAELFEAILTQTSLERLRVSSLDPTEITPAIRELMAREPRFCAHFHVSLQAAHSKILKLMKRKYQLEHVRECLTSIANLPSPIGGVFVGMDMITGFPGETDEDFESSFNELKALPWSRLHVFPYSEREGTPATRLPGVVPQHVRMARAKRLRDLSFERLQSVYRATRDEAVHSGRRLDSVLLESATRGPDGTDRWVSGYSRNYLRAMIQVESRERALELENTVVSPIPGDLILDTAAGDVSLLARL